MQSIPFYAQSLLSGLFTFLVTVLGASLIFLFKKANQKVLDIMLGFAGGVMLAASFWSLLNPAINQAEILGYIPWLISSLGFLLGGIFILLTGILLNKFSFNVTDKENSNRLKKGFLLFFATTMHNIPEGLAVGVAFGGLAIGTIGCTFSGAIMIALSIGIQNFPEGIAVAFPLKRAGLSSTKSFLFGSLSGIVEPIFCMVGFFLATLITSILPFLLSFSAGAMIGVVASELIPEATENNKYLATSGFILGFVIMMILDVALG